DQDDPDTYIVCEGIPVTVTPNFQTQYLRRTNVYDVEPIDFDTNSFPFTGGTELSNPVYDFYDVRAECPVELPFKFSYFNKTYERIYVWANGAVTFTDETDCSTSPYVSYVPVTWNGTNWGGPFSGPIPGGVDNPNFLNSIFGSYQHTHWVRNTYPAGSINYQVYGEAPCRKFVISFSGLPAAGLNNSCPPPVPFQSHQIVLHELTNVIDINTLQ